MLDIQLNLLVFEIVTFLTLLFLLNRIMFQPLLSHLDSRFASLSNDQEAIASNLQEAAAMKAEAEKVIADAKREGRSKIDTAVASAKAAAAARLDAQKEKVSGEVASYEAALSQEIATLKEALMANQAEYASAVRQKVRG